jgi:hypothetical protein
MIIIAAVLLAIGVLVFTLGIRNKDLPEPEPESPFKHLDEHKATIYENLRDLQFEYRLGKLSDHDYQQTKQDLQKELAAVMAEVDALQQKLAPQGAAAAAAAKPAPAPRKKPAPAAESTECPHCGAKFAKPMKFCGECGKPMLVEAR